MNIFTKTHFALRIVSGRKVLHLFSEAQVAEGHLMVTEVFTKFVVKSIRMESYLLSAARVEVGLLGIVCFFFTLNNYI